MLSSARQAELVICEHTIYHFVRTHESLRVELAAPRDREGKRTPQRYRQRTPAMAAGLTNRRWTVGELLALPMVPEVAAFA